ncbi:hypothetical protein LJC32_03470 [Oscillospiraceae bacterium OttesenSCG-928-F05]|nr:hypothetical protein [Oscillospiraceae bacterium OttesenSCG-928-F05]
MEVFIGILFVLAALQIALVIILYVKMTKDTLALKRRLPPESSARREARLYQLYQNLEELMEAFEAYVEETREEFRDMQAGETPHQATRTRPDDEAVDIKSAWAKPDLFAAGAEAPAVSLDISPAARKKAGEAAATLAAAAARMDIAARTAAEEESFAVVPEPAEADVPEVPPVRETPVKAISEVVAPQPMQSSPAPVAPPAPVVATSVGTGAAAYAAQQPRRPALATAEIAVEFTPGVKTESPAPTEPARAQETPAAEREAPPREKLVDDDDPDALIELFNAVVPDDLTGLNIVRPMKVEKKEAVGRITEADREAMRRFATKPQKIRLLNSKGYSAEVIARELSIGRGEVDVVLNLDK